VKLDEALPIARLQKAFEADLDGPISLSALRAWMSRITPSPRSVNTTYIKPDAANPITA